mmetsp:Transcript_55167/g.145627  ORF Transcript_55167/g.145627 Transcript_55167/m.145627 type:complete len:107 (-) Transcript_55167:491-811(-)
MHLLAHLLLAAAALCPSLICSVPTGAFLNESSNTSTESLSALPRHFPEIRVNMTYENIFIESFLQPDSPYLKLDFESSAKKVPWSILIGGWYDLLSYTLPALTFIC